MSEVDNRIVQLQFDTADFDKNVDSTIKSLDKLKDSLDLDESKDSFKDIEKAAKNINFDGVASSIDQVGESVDRIANKFTLMGTIGQKVIGQLADTIVNATESAVGFFTTANLAGGFEKYSTSTKATQTILAAIKDTPEYNGDRDRALADIKKTLGTLQSYTDETSYSFSEMVTTIGKFTAAGVGLGDAERAMEGLSNAAAKAGVGVSGANQAMAQVAQGISKGYFQVIDWQSLENYNIATADFKQTIMEAAVMTGDLKQLADGSYRTAKGTQVTAENFRTTLNEKWLSSGSFLTAMDMYADRETQFGQEAFEAAQKALTFSDAVQALKDSMTTGWMGSFTYIFGDLDDSITLWTDFCNAIISVTSAFDIWRNTALQKWHDGGFDEFGRWISEPEEGQEVITGRQIAMQGLADAGSAVLDIFRSIKEAYANIFEGGRRIIGDGSLTYDSLLGGLIDFSTATQSVGAQIKEMFGYIRPEDYEIDWDTNFSDRQVEELLTYTDGLKNVYYGFEEASNAKKNAQKDLEDMEEMLRTGMNAAGEKLTENEAIQLEKSIQKQKKYLDSFRLLMEDDILTNPIFNGELGLGSKDTKKKKDKKGNVIQEATDDVSKLQKNLNLLRAADKQISEDGVFGKGTKKALEEFQKQAGLKPTGIYDEATHDKLIERLEKEGKLVKDVQKGGAVRTQFATFFEKGQGLTAVEHIFELIMSIGRLVGNIAGTAVRAFGMVLSAATPIINFLFTVVSTLSSILTSIVMVFATSSVFNSVLESLQALLYPIQLLLDSIFTPLASVVETVGGYIQQYLVGGFAQLIGVAESFISIISGILSFFAFDAVNSINVFVEAFSLLQRAIESGDPAKFIEQLRERGEKLVSSDVLSTLQSLYDIYVKFKNAGSSIMDALGFGKNGKTGSTIQKVVSKFKTWRDALKLFFNERKNDKPYTANDLIPDIKSGKLNSDTFSVLEKLRGGFTALSNFTGKVWDDILKVVGEVPGVISTVFGFITGLFNSIGNSQIGTKIKSAWEEVKGYFKDLTPEQLFTDMGTLWDSFSSWISGIWTQIKESSVWETISESLNSALQTIGNALGPIWTWIESVFNRIFEVLFPGSSKAKGETPIDDAANQLEESKSKIDAVIKWFNDNIGSRIQAIIDMLFPKKKGDGDGAAAEVEEQAGLLEQAAELFNSAIQVLSNAVTSAIGWVFNLLGIPWEAPKANTEKGASGITEGSNQLMSAGELLMQAIGVLKDAFNDAMQWVLGLFGVDWKAAFAGLGDGAEEGASDAEKAENLGKKFKAAFGAIKEAFGNFVEFIGYIIGINDKNPFDKTNQTIEEGSKTADDANSLSSKLKPITDALSAAWTGFVTILGKIFGFKVEAKSEGEDPIPQVEGKVKEAESLAEKIDGVVGTLQGAWDQVKKFFANLFNGDGETKPGSKEGGFFSGIKEFFSNLFSEGEESKTIGERVDGLLKSLGEIWNTIKAFIAGLFGAEIETPTDGGDSSPMEGVKDKLTSTENDAEETQTIGQKIDAKIKAIKEFFSNIFKRISDFIADLTKGLGITKEPDGGFEEFKRMSGIVEETEADAEETMTLGQRIQSIVESIDTFFKGIKAKAKSIWETITGIFEKIFGKEDGGKPSDVTQDAEDVAGEVEKTKSIGERIGETIKSIVDFFKNIFGSGEGVEAMSLGERIKGVFSSIKEFFTGTSDLSASVDGAGSIGEGASNVITNIIQFVKNIISGIFELGGKGLEKVVSIVGKLIGFIAVCFVFYELFRTMRTLVMTIEDMTSVAAVPWELAHYGSIFLALLMLSRIISQVSNMDSGSFAKLATLIGEVGILMVLINVFSGKMASLDPAKLAAANKGLAAYSGAILAIGGSLYLISMAAKNLSSVSWTDLLKLGSIFGALMLIVWAIGKFAMPKIPTEASSNLLQFAGVLLAIGASMILLSYAVKILSGINADSLWRAIGALAAIIGILVVSMIAIIGSIALLTKISPGILANFNAKEAMLSIAATLIGISMAVILMTMAIMMLSLIPEELFKRGAERLAKILTGIVALLAVLTMAGMFFKSGFVGIGSVLFGISALLISITAAITILSSMPFDKFISGFAKILAVIIFGIFPILMVLSQLNGLMSSVDGKLNLTPLLTLVGVAIIIATIAAALYVIQDVDTGVIFAFMTSLVFVIAAIGLVVFTVSKIQGTNNLTGFFTLLSIALVIGTIAAALWVISTFNVDTGVIITFLGGLLAVFIAIAAMMFTLSLALKGANAATAFTTLFLFAGIIGTIYMITDALKMLVENDIDIASAASFISSFGALFAGIGILVAGIAVLGMIPAPAIAIGILGFIGIVAAITALAISLNALDSLGGIVTKGFRKLAEIIGIFVEEIQAASIKGLARGAKAFEEANIDPEAFNATFELLKSLKDFGEGFNSKNNVGKNFQSFANGIASLGDGLAALQTSTEGVELDTSKIQRLMSAITPIKDLAKTFDGIDLGKGPTKKTSAWETFVDSLKAFSTSVSALNRAVTGITDINAVSKKLKTVTGAIGGIAKIAKSFVTVGGDPIDLGSVESIHSSFFRNTKDSKTGTGWIGFIDSLNDLGGQISAMNASLKDVSVEDSNELKTKLGKIVPALEGFASVFSVIQSVPRVNSDEAYAIQVLSDLLPKDAGKDGIFGDNWGEFLLSIPKVAKQMTEAGKIAKQAQDDYGLDDNWAKNSVQPMVDVLNSLASLYTDLAGIKIEEIKTDGETIFTNVAYRDMIDSLVGTNGEGGLANQVAEFAKIIGGWQEIDGKMKQVENGLNTKGQKGFASFSEISGNVTTALSGIANVIKVLAQAQVDLANIYKDIGGTVDSGALTEFELFGDNGIITKFIDIMGNTSDASTASISLGEAIKNYASLIEGLGGKDATFPTNSEQAMATLRGIAQFFTDLTGTGDGSYNLSGDMFENGWWAHLWGDDGIIAKFVELVGGSDTSMKTPLGTAIGNFVRDMNSTFGGEYVVDADGLDERVSKGIGLLRDLAQFIHDISNSAETGDISFEEGDITKFRSFVDSMSEFANVDDGIDQISFASALQNIGSLFGEKGSETELDPEAARTNVQKLVESLKVFATFISELNTGSEYNLDLTNGIFSVLTGAGKFVNVFTTICQAVSDIGQSDVDETGLQKVQALQTVLTSLGTVFTAFAQLNSGGESVTGITGAIQGILTLLSGEGTDTSTWSGNFDAEGVTAAITAFNDTVTTTIENATTKLTSSLDTYQMAGQQAAQIMSSSISESMSTNAADAGVEASASGAVAKGAEYNSQFQSMGSSWSSSIGTGITMGAHSAIAAAGRLANQIIQTVNSRLGIGSPSKVFAAIGRWCSVGLGNGLKNSTMIATAKAKYVAKKTIEATKKETDVGSPSKVFARLGTEIDESLASGIEGSTKEVSGSASGLLNKTLSAMSSVIDSNIDTQPTIRPVMDLTDVSKGSGLINGLIPNSKTIALNSKVLAANAGGTLTPNQNGSNNSTYNNQSYGGMSFAGAVFNVRSDNDIRGIATELAALNAANMQSHGII